MPPRHFKTLFSGALLRFESMIHLIKILEYDRKPNDKDAFDRLCNIASQKIDPPSLRPGSLRLNASVVFYSPLRRSAECLRMERNVLYIPTPLLKEIPFDMREMCSKEEWIREKSALVRRKFRESFMEDRLMEKRGDIFRAAKEFLAQYRSFIKTSDVSAVSHSFRMKILEAFIKTKGRIEEDPSLISLYIHDDEKTFEFGEGFDVGENDILFLNGLRA